MRRAIEAPVERTRSLLNKAQEIGNIGNFEVHVPDTEAGSGAALHGIFGPTRWTTGSPRVGLGASRDVARQAADWRHAIADPGSYASEFRIVTPADAVRPSARSTTPVPAAKARCASPARSRRHTAARSRPREDSRAAHDPRPRGLRPLWARWRASPTS